MSKDHSNSKHSGSSQLPSNYVAFVLRLSTILSDMKEISLPDLANLAAQFKITDKSALKALVEFAFVIIGRQISNNDRLSNWLKYIETVILSKCQLFLHQALTDEKPSRKGKKEKPSRENRKEIEKPKEKLTIEEAMQRIIDGELVEPKGSHFKENQYREFPAPLPIAYLMGQWCGYARPKKVFNPVARNGLLELMPWHGRVTVNDPRPFCQMILRVSGFEHITDADPTQPLEEFYRRFDAVQVNPPNRKAARKETFKNYQTADLDKIISLHALDTMKGKGRAAILLCEHSVKFKKEPGKAQKEFLDFLQAHYEVSDIIQIDSKKLYQTLKGPTKFYLILIDGRRTKPQLNADFLVPYSKPVVSEFEELKNRVFGPMLQSKAAMNGIAAGLGSIAKTEINYLDLFAGLGAFPKGLLDAGFSFKNHYYSEIDKHAIANYKYNFKNATYVGGVQEIKTKKIQRPDLITFGSPCQNLSNAGKQEGIFGDRSKLFFDAIGIIDRMRPKVFVFENVKGLFSSNQGKDFEVVLHEIAKLGVYECQWQLINSAWFLPQNRERIFLVGCLREIGSPQIFPLSTGYEESEIRKARIKVVAQKSEHQTGRIYSKEGLSPTLMSSGGYVNGFVKIGNRARKLTPIECERLQGLPDNWTRFGNYDSEKKEISDHVRYELLGNAITSTVMKAIAKKLKSTGLNGLPNPQITLPEERSISIIDKLRNFGYEQAD